MIRFTALFACCCASAWAQVGAPLLGYVPGGGEIRPAYGIPAAASVGPALDFGGSFALAAISPHQDYALGSLADSGAVVLAIPGTGAAPLTGASASPDKIVLSPLGSAAALWFGASGQLQIVTGLPGSPSIRNLSAAFLNAAPSALAVSDDGAWVAGAWPDGVYAFGPDGSVQRLPERERATALAFYANQSALAIATRTHVFSLSGLGSGAVPVTLYTGGPLNTVGMAVTSGNGHIVIADQSGSILNLDLNAGSSASLNCGCAPQGVFPMGGAILRLTGFDGSSFRIFDANAGAVLLVPLAAAPQGGAQ